MLDVEQMHIKNTLIKLLRSFYIITVYYIDLSTSLNTMCLTNSSYLHRLFEFKIT